MPIEINKSTERIPHPSIRLIGKVVNEGHGTYPGNEHPDTADTISTLDVEEGSDVITALDFRKREVLVYQGNVRVAIIPDTLNGRFEPRVYTNRDKLNDIIGSNEDIKTQMNRRSETYYTINGKDPVRTKANIYTGAFTVRQNLSGSDNIVLKARTYCQGAASEVMTVEFRILRSDTNRV